MAAATAHWRTPNGERWVQSDPRGNSISLDIEANANPDPGDEDGIDEVEIYVDDGSTTNTIVVSAASMRSPNYSTGDSPSTGRVGGHARFHGWGTELDLTTQTAGVLTITASVFTTLGTETQLPAILVMNDTDGGDRRPSPKIIHGDLSGSPTGAGTEGDPISELSAALAAAATSGECGLAEIHWHGDLIGAGGGFSTPAWHTNSGFPITVRAMDAGAKIRRTNLATGTSRSATAFPADYITGAAGSIALVRFVGFDSQGDGLHLYNGGGALTVGLEIETFDCFYASAFDDGGVPHVDWFRDTEGKPVCHFESTTGGLTRHWGLTCEAFAFGIASAASVHDVHMDRGLGVYMQPTTTQVDDPCYTSIRGHGLRYNPGETRGYVGEPGENGNNPGGPLEAGAALSVTMSGTTMRITLDAATVPNVDIAAHGIDLIGSPYWGIGVQSSGNAGNNGFFPVTAVGYDGSNPWIECTNASGVNDAAMDAAAFIETYELGGANRPYHDAVHTDFVQFWDGPFIGCQLVGARWYDMHNTRGIVCDAQTMTRGVIKFTFDGSPNTGFPNDNQNSWVGATLTDCLFLGNSWRSRATQFATTTVSGGAIVDNAFGLVSDLTVGDCYVDNNRYEAGTAYGTNVGGSPAAFFANDASVTPWDAIPLSGQLDTASGLVPYPTEWRWTGATGDSIGVPSAYGDGDYSVTAGPSALDLTGGLPELVLTPFEGSVEFGDPPGEPGPAIDNGRLHIGLSLSL